MKQVVITGMGVITPLGLTVETFWSRLLAGESGIANIDSIDTTGLKTHFAGTIKDFRIEEYVDRKEARRMDLFCQYGVAAALQAVNDAGLDFAQLDPYRVGVYIGSGIGGIQTMLDNHHTLLERGPGRVSPTLVPMMITNMAAAQVSMLLGAKGPTMAPVTACSIGNTAIGEAFKLIQRDGADVVIAGGAEATINELAIAGFGNATVLSSRRNNPQQASRPFDTERDGLVMAEGAGVVVLESLEHAIRRHAAIHAEIIGYGASSDAFHMVAPDPEGSGAFAAMKTALADAGITPADVDHINAHATSTPAGDLAEAKAIQRLFGERTSSIPITANKSALGHMFGAAGGVEAVALIKTLQQGLIPPTLNYELPDPACGLGGISSIVQQAPVRIGLSNSFGFGGHNAVIVLQRYAQGA